MTATKNNSIFKKLGALAMAMCLTCALAVSASAVDVGSYTATLEAQVSFPPHDLDFFAGDAVVTNSGTTSTVKVPLKDPATVTVFGIERTGSIAEVAITENSEALGYDCSLAEETTSVEDEETGEMVTVTTKYLVITCPSSVAAGDFEPVITFSVTLDDGGSHSDVDAKVTLA